MIKGRLVSPTGDAKIQKILDDWVPVEYIIEWFRDRLTKAGVGNRVLILKSETASGKSTAFPPELYKAHVMGKGSTAPGIICTQPKVLTAIENVNEMLKHYSAILKKGDTIGWSTKYNKLKPTSHGLLSATIGTLTQQLKIMTDEQIMDTYRFILIDETHERDLQTDMTIYMLKNLLLRNQGNPLCPFVVLMSATFDPQSFLDYFSVRAEDNFIWCRGATARIDEMWDWNKGKSVHNFMQAAVTVCEKILTENPDDPSETADILIFMPGAAELGEVARGLAALNKKLAEAGKKVFSPLQVESRAVQEQNLDYKRLIYIPIEQQIQRIGGKGYVPTRRIVSSTNVAETGLTLDNLKYVIDCGYNREMEFNPQIGVRGLLTKPAPQSRIRQRRGRVGRKFPGVFYPLYPKAIHDSLPVLQFPQILIEDVSPILLDVIYEQLKVKFTGRVKAEFIVEDIDMIDVPSPDALGSSLEKMYSLGFLSPITPEFKPDLAEFVAEQPRANICFGLTRLGAVARLFSGFSVENTRMFMAAYNYGCSVMDIITIIAYTTVESKQFVAAVPLPQVEDADTDTTPSRVQPPPLGWAAVYKAGFPGFLTAPLLLYKLRLLVCCEFIDGIALFNAVKGVVNAATTGRIFPALSEWCRQHNVSYPAVMNFIRVRDELIEQLLTCGLEIFSQESMSVVNSSAETFMDIITRIKYCIYDGYRNNIIIREGEYLPLAPPEVTGGKSKKHGHAQSSLSPNIPSTPPTSPASPASPAPPTVNKPVGPPPPTYRTLMGAKVMTPKIFREDEKQTAIKGQYGDVAVRLPRVMVYGALSMKFNRKTDSYDLIAGRVSSMDGFIGGHDEDFLM